MRQFIRKFTNAPANIVIRDRCTASLDTNPKNTEYAGTTTVPAPTPPAFVIVEITTTTRKPTSSRALYE